MYRIALLAFIALSLQLSAQENSGNKYGVYANFGLNMHTADFRALPGVPNCCPKFQDGDGLGLSLGALFEMNFTSELFLAARLGYTDLSGKLSSVEPTTIILNNVEADGEFTHTVDANIQAVTAQLLAGYRIFPILAFMRGLALVT